MKTLDINDYYSISGEQKPVLESIVDTFKHQANALNEMANSIDFEQYQKAISYIINCQGHVIVCGMGK